MPEMTIAELAALSGNEYIAEIKSRLTSEEGWAMLLSPSIAGRTRWGLGAMIRSLDEQIERVKNEGRYDENWLRRVDTLRFYAQNRLDQLTPRPVINVTESSSKESRAWRSFAARLAQALEDGDLSVLDSLKTPYGNLTARQWLDAREKAE